MLTRLCRVLCWKVAIGYGNVRRGSFSDGVPKPADDGRHASERVLMSAIFNDETDISIGRRQKLFTAPNVDSMPLLPAVSTLQSLSEECDASSGRAIVEVGRPSWVTDPAIGCPAVSQDRWEWNLSNVRQLTSKSQIQPQTAETCCICLPS